MKTALASEKEREGDSQRDGMGWEEGKVSDGDSRKDSKAKSKISARMRARDGMRATK